ncbi:MAG: VWA domain-containing protein [Anaerolineae bacterium]|nr:VWA domain-containing protein [Anaerolineae bacterium]
MFNPLMYANSRPDGVGVLEIVGDSETKQFVPLRRTELRGEITGPLAALTVVHTYGYSHKECDKVLEAVYRFPLPGDAAVTGARVRFGDVEITAQLKEREQAEADYQEAVLQGKQATLLTRESPSVFTLRVAGIQPDEEVLIQTDYVQLVRPYGDAAGWVLRVPLTTAPRYVRQDELDPNDPAKSRHAQGQPLALLRDPGHRFALNVLVRDVGEVTSPTHRIETFLDEREHDRRIQLREGEVIPDRDFVMTWTPYQHPDRPALSVMLHEDQIAGQVYFMALVAPPSEHKPGSGVPREIVLLVDHSGSMSGAKWAASDWTVNSFFSRLVAHDTFALGLFHNTTKWFKSEPASATEANLSAAAAFLDRNRDSGGTELGVALEQALKLKRGKHQASARHVLLVTDAEVSDESRLFRLADQEASRKDDVRRISVLCIDAAPNSFLATELAERGGGVAYFLTSSPDEEDITTSLENLLGDWSEPVLTGLTLEINRMDGEASGREVKKESARTVIDLGDLPCGRTVWVAGRVPARDGDLVFRAVTPEKEVAAVTARSDGNVQPALKALFGARRLLGLEYLIHARYDPEQLKSQLKRLGYDPGVLADKEGSVYAENAYKSALEALKPLLVRESLSYGIACAETAFVAVRTEAGKPVEATSIVANALPSGWSDDFLSRQAPVGAGYMGAVPSGATPSFAVLSPSPAPPRAMAKSKSLFKRMAMPEEAEEFMDMAPPVSEGPAPVSARDQAVFSGEPVFANGESVLFDSAKADSLPPQVTFTRIEVAFAKGAPKSVDRGLQLLLFVGDMALPRATIRLADLLRGGRPLNLRRGAGNVVRIVLVDPNAAWAAGSPHVTVTLSW